MTTTTKKQSNSLVYKTSKTVGKETIYVNIRLNDECKNGHQDFAITGDIYEADKPKIDKYYISGGCIHEEIEKHFPEFKSFIRLHLCDYQGVPMHAVENGFYHLRTGFNKTKPEDAGFSTEYCDYYRITLEQFNKLNETENKLQFALALQNLGILEQWKQEANKAISYIEELTNTDFIVDSKKSQYHKPTEEELKTEAEKQANGFYTQEAKVERAKQREVEILDKLSKERDKEILKATTEFEVKKQVLLIGGEAALNNCIFYNHSNTLAFNWKGYDHISQGLIDKIKEQAQMPEGITITDKG